MAAYGRRLKQEASSFYRHHHRSTRGWLGIAAEWDFDGKGAFPIRSTVAKGVGTVTVKMSHRFDEPGTWFPPLRGISQRDGDVSTPYARVQNLGRARVVVQ